MVPGSMNRSSNMIVPPCGWRPDHSRRMRVRKLCCGSTKNSHARQDGPDRRPHNPGRNIWRAGGGNGPTGAGLSTTAKVSGPMQRTLRAPRHLLTLPRSPVRACRAGLGPSFCRGTGSSMRRRLCGRVVRGQSRGNRCLGGLSLVLGRSDPPGSAVKGVSKGGVESRWQSSFQSSCAASSFLRSQEQRRRPLPIGDSVAVPAGVRGASRRTRPMGD